MKKFMRFSVRRPIVFGFLLFLAYTFLSTLTWPVTQLATWPEGHEWGTALAKLLMAMCFILVLWGFGWLRGSGFVGLGARWVWPLAVVLVMIKAAVGVYAFIGSFQFTFPGPELTLAVLVYTLMTSLLEETMYRGLLMRVMVKAWGSTRRGLVAAAALSGLFWGSTHFINLIIRPFPLVGLQVLETALSGLLYGALVLSGGSIWPAVLVHWLLNASISLQIAQIPNYQEPASAWLILSSATLVLSAVAVPLIRVARLQTRNVVDHPEDQLDQPLGAVSE